MLREVQKKKTSTGRKTKKILYIFLILIFLLILFWFVFRIQDVDVKGCSYYSQDQMINRVKKSIFDQNSLLLYLKYKYFKKADIPFIQDIDIELKTSSHVVIRVYEKVIIGCIVYMGQYMYFDKDGIVVESSNRSIDGIPVIVGLKFDRLVPGKPLNVKKKELYSVILNITQMINKYKIEADKIVFEQNNNVNLVIGDITVLMGKHEVYDGPIANLQGILPKARGLKGELDMRNYNEDTGIVVFRKKS